VEWLKQKGPIYGVDSDHYVEKTEGITSYGYIVKNSGEGVLLASASENPCG